MSELKPCPFCGGVPKPKPSKDECWWHECGCRTVIINYEEWNTRPIEDELRAELEKRTAELHYANTACMEMKHELDRLKEENHALDQINRDIQTAAAHLDEVLAELARRDEKISTLVETVARLKEDGERMADFFIEGERGNSEVFVCIYCDAPPKFQNRKLEHEEYCPVSKHDALMKELEESENE